MDTERISTGSQQVGEVEASENIRAALEQTQKNATDFSDDSIARSGFRGLIDYDRALKADGGGDGIYGHLVTLRIIKSNDKYPDLADFFSINQMDSGRMEVVGVRREEDGHAQGFMAALDGEGKIIEGFPTDERDMFKKQIGSSDLSPEEAEAFVRGVKDEFDGEIARRIAALQNQN